MTPSGKLAPAEIDTRLQSLAGWTLKDGRLHRDFKFASFPEAFAFMTHVAFIAEKMDHHPDWMNSYTTVAIDLSSHDVAGLSDRDFRLAAAINAVEVRNDSQPR